MSTSGIFVRTGGLAQVLDDLKDVRMIYLREDGLDIRGLGAGALAGDAAFILGDHTGMTPEEETMISKAGAEVVSLGPTSLHADHCIVLTELVFGCMQNLKQVMLPDPGRIVVSSKYPGWCISSNSSEVKNSCHFLYVTIETDRPFLMAVSTFTNPSSLRRFTEE